jgi:hypothetical protein
MMMRKKSYQHLCDISSLDSIRNSNNSLCKICIGYNSSLPSNITELLQMNASGDASEVARLKILCHDKGINIESLVEKAPELPHLKGKLVPFLISCLVRKHGLPHFIALSETRRPCLSAQVSPQII